MNTEERLADLRSKVAKLHDWLQDRAKPGTRGAEVVTVKSVLFVMQSLDLCGADKAERDGVAEGDEKECVDCSKPSGTEDRCIPCGEFENARILGTWPRAKTRGGDPS